MKVNLEIFPLMNGNVVRSSYSLFISGCSGLCIEYIFLFSFAVLVQFLFLIKRLSYSQKVAIHFKYQNKMIFLPLYLLARFNIYTSHLFFKTTEFVKKHIFKKQINKYKSILNNTIGLPRILKMKQNKIPKIIPTNPSSCLILVKNNKYIYLVSESNRIEFPYSAVSLAHMHNK